MRMLTILMLASGVALHGAPALASEVVVIVSLRNPTLALSNSEAADIFLGKRYTFPDGVRAAPIDLAEGAPAREAFYVRTSGKQAPQLTAYWSKMIFTGQGRPPQEARDSASAKKLVADNPNAIAYIDKSKVDASVKVVLTLP